jgi:hypothetical protein
VCYLACSCLVFFLYLEYCLGWHTCQYIPLAILGFDHFISGGAFHLVGTLHIRPWSCLPWDSHVDWLHASCGPLAIFGWLLWSILLGGLLYFFISYTSWRLT